MIRDNLLHITLTSFKVNFEPKISFQEAKPDSFDDFMNLFKEINVGTNIYTIKAMRNPEVGQPFIHQ